jgi:hypothetical protein
MGRRKAEVEKVRLQLRSANAAKECMKVNLEQATSKSEVDAKSSCI